MQVKNNVSGVKFSNNLNFASKNNVSVVKLSNNLNYLEDNQLGKNQKNRIHTKMNEILNSVCGTVYFDCEGIRELAVGVNIVVNGTSIGTTTDIAGNYCISPVYPGTTLVYSYVGFITTELVLKSNGASCENDFCISNVDDVILHCDVSR